MNAIAPGEIDTDILSPGTSQIVENDIPMRRLGTVHEVADLVEFLCSDKASYITGAEIPDRRRANRPEQPNLTAASR